MDKLIGELTQEQLALFKLHNECIQHAKSKQEYAGSQVAVQVRDSEILRLKAEIYRLSEVVRKADAYDRAVKEYQEFRDKLSKELGFELEGKSICPITGAIKEIAETKSK